MALEANRAFAETLGLFLVISWLGIFVGHFTIDGDGHFFPFDFDVVCKPFVVLVPGFLDILKAINTTRLTPVLLGGIDLAFITLGGPALVLKFSVNEDPRVGIFGSLNFALKFKVLELGIAVCPIKEVGTRTFHFNRAIFNGEGLWAFRIDLPTFEGFSVEHLNPIPSKGERSGSSKNDGD